MIGTTVQRGFDKWGGNPASASGLTGDNSTALNSTMLIVNGTLVSANGTDGPTGLIEKEDEAMSQEELNVRLSYAMSLTFMVGIIQVSKSPGWLCLNNKLRLRCSLETVSDVKILFAVLRITFRSV